MQANLLEKALVSNVVQQLCETICGHVLGTYVFKGEMAVFDLIFDVMVVDINVFGTLMMALACHKLDGGLVAAIELDRTNVVAVVDNLLQQASEPGSFFSGISEADVLCFSS
jgi:hypothetical protein